MGKQALAGTPQDDFSIFGTFVHAARGPRFSVGNDDNWAKALRGLIPALLLLNLLVASEFSLAQSVASDSSRAELEWRAADLQVAVEDFVAVTRQEPSLRSPKQLADMVESLRATTQRLQRSVATRELRLSAVGTELDEVIRGMQQVRDALPRQMPPTAERRWNGVVDALTSFQGQYESVRARAPTAPQITPRERGAWVPSDRGTPAQLGAGEGVNSTLSQIEHTLVELTQRAPSIVSSAEDRAQLDFLLARTRFIATELNGSLLPRELRDRELTRLVEDGKEVRRMLQRYPYDVSLGTLWSSARTHLEAIESQLSSSKR